MKFLHLTSMYGLVMSLLVPLKYVAMMDF